VKRRYISGEKMSIDKICCGKAELYKERCEANLKYAMMNPHRNV